MCVNNLCVVVLCWCTQPVFRPTITRCTWRSLIIVQWFASQRHTGGTKHHLTFVLADIFWRLASSQNLGFGLEYLALFSTLPFSRCIWVCPFLLGFLPALVFWKRTLRINAAGFYRPDILSGTQPAMTKHWSELKALTQWRHIWLASYFLYGSSPDYLVNECHSL